MQRKRKRSRLVVERGLGTVWHTCDCRNFYLSVMVWSSQTHLGTISFTVVEYVFVETCTVLILIHMFLHLDPASDVRPTHTYCSTSSRRPQTCWLFHTRGRASTMHPLLACLFHSTLYEQPCTRPCLPLIPAYHQYSYYVVGSLALATFRRMQPRLLVE